jgi:hypothetical protein
LYSNALGRCGINARKGYAAAIGVDDFSVSSVVKYENAHLGRRAD